MEQKSFFLTTNLIYVINQPGPFRSDPTMTLLDGLFVEQFKTCKLKFCAQPGSKNIAFLLKPDSCYFSYDFAYTSRTKCYLQDLTGYNTNQNQERFCLKNIVYRVRQKFSDLIKIFNFTRSPYCLV